MSRSRGVGSVLSALVLFRARTGDRGRRLWLIQQITTAAVAASFLSGNGHAGSVLACAVDDEENQKTREGQIARAEVAAVDKTRGPC